MRASVSVSTEENASSRTRIGASERSARARAVRCFWPPESVIPRSPTTVSRPFGKRATSGARPAARTAASISARDASGRANATFAASVSEKRNVSCGTAARLRLTRAAAALPSRSRPPTKIVPGGGSSTRRRRFRSVDLPAPVRPTIATVAPRGTRNDDVVEDGAVRVAPREAAELDVPGEGLAALGLLGQRRPPPRCPSSGSTTPFRAARGSRPSRARSRAR